MTRDRRIRVAVIENTSAVSGSVRSILHAATHLRDRVDFVFVGPRNEAVVRAGFPHVEMSFVQLRRHPSIVAYAPTLALHSARLARVVRERAIDVVHVNDFYNLVGLASRALGADAALVYHVRLLATSYAGALQRLLMPLVRRGADAVLAVSEAAKRDAGGSSVAVVPDGIPILRTPPPSRVQDERVQVVYIGHLIPGKGQDIALDAFTEAYASCSSLRLRFVGGTLGLASNEAFAERLRASVHARGLGDCVTFTGPSDDVARDLADSDIVLNLSESESFSIVCLEAMAAARPLVASDSGGPGELLAHDGTGFLVPNRDARAAADALVRLARDRALREAMGRAAHADARARYDVSITAEQLFSAYERAIGVASRSARR